MSVPDEGYISETCLIYVICVCLRKMLSDTYCVWGVFLVGFFVFLFFVLRILYPILPVSLDCPFLIAHSVFSNVLHFLRYANNQTIGQSNTILVFGTK